MAEMGVGDTISLEGRIQSRKYIKTENGVSTERTAYEGLDSVADVGNHTCVGADFISALALF